MKKQLRRLRFLAVVLLLVSLFFTTAYGSEAEVSFACEETVAAGTSFSAALEYQGATFGTAICEVTYDADILKFSSCSGGEGFIAEEGMARIQFDGGDGRAYLSGKIRFRALAEGESFITVTTTGLQAADGTELVAETRSVKVTVVPEPQQVVSPEDTAGSGNGQQPVASPETVLVAAPEAAPETVPEDGNASAITRAVIHGRELLRGLSETEFLLLALCTSVALLLIILLLPGAFCSPRKRKSQKRRNNQKNNLVEEEILQQLNELKNEVSQLRRELQQQKSENA